MQREARLEENKTFLISFYCCSILLQYVVKQLQVRAIRRLTKDTFTTKTEKKYEKLAALVICGGLSVAL